MMTLFAFSAISHNVNAQENSTFIEWAPFEVRLGVSDEELMQASERVQNEFLVKQKGYIKRELLKGKDNQWADLVYWESEEDAKAAIPKTMDSEACGVFFGLMEGMEDIADPAEGAFHYKKMAGWD